jgi:hypothetical protein
VIRLSISAVVILIVVAACGASGGGPAPSSVAAATGAPSSGPSASPQGVAAGSCVPRPGYSNVPGGTRVDDPADGFSITLPHGWAQIELATGDVVPAFSGLTMEPSTAARVKAIGSGAESAGWVWLAVDLAPGAGGSQLATPADLLVALTSASGETLDSIAAGLTSDLRASGVTGNIEQIRLGLAGGDGLEIRYAEVTHDLDGKLLASAVTDYITLHGDMQFTMAFSVAAESSSGSAAIINAMAQSLEIHPSGAPGCSGTTP